MTNIFKSKVKILFLCLAIFLPLTTHAQTNWKFIFRHPLDYHELWFGIGDDERRARRIFRLPRPISTFSIQKEGHYIVAVAHDQEWVGGKIVDWVDVYLFDWKHPGAASKNLTRGEYSQIPDVAISRNGDIVFSNLSFVIPKNGKLIRGLYLIPFREIEKPRPKAELLLQVNAGGVEWTPNGKGILYGTDWGIFHFDIRTKEVSHITGGFPVFSPDGEKTAFLTEKTPKKIGIKTAGQRAIKYIGLEDRGLEEDPDLYVEKIMWSVDGQSIVCTIFNGFDGTYSNFAVPIGGGDAEQIFEAYFEEGLSLFAWTHTAYTVEPANRLTTLWGQLKAEDKSK